MLASLGRCTDALTRYRACGIGLRLLPRSRFMLRIKWVVELILGQSVVLENHGNVFFRLGLVGLLAAEM